MGRQDWCTPKWLFRYLDSTYGPFDVDAAATADNALCDRYFADGLNCDWGTCRTFCNPPFKNMAPWVNKAIEAASNGFSIVVMIAPASISSLWFHRAIKSGATVIFPNKRIAFEHSSGVSSPDRDTVILVFGDRPIAQFQTLDVRSLGAGTAPS